MFIYILSLGLKKYEVMKIYLNIKGKGKSKSNGKGKGKDKRKATSLQAWRFP